MENTTYSAKKFIESTNQDILELAQRGKFVEIQKMFVEYAASVRTEVVVPKKIEIDYDEPVYYRKKAENHNMLIDKIKSLNPSLTFTELNHEK